MEGLPISSPQKSSCWTTNRFSLTGTHICLRTTLHWQILQLKYGDTHGTVLCFVDLEFSSRIWSFISFIILVITGLRSAWFVLDKERPIWLRERPIEGSPLFADEDSANRTDEGCFLDWSTWEASRKRLCAFADFSWLNFVMVSKELDVFGGGGGDAIEEGDSDGGDCGCESSLPDPSAEEATEKWLW